jgi:hypothetical protein
VKAMAPGCNSGTVLQVRQLFHWGVLAQRADTDSLLLHRKDAGVRTQAYACGLDRPGGVEREPSCFRGLAMHSSSPASEKETAPEANLGPQTANWRFYFRKAFKWGWDPEANR